jgi:hypothetical protein
MKYIAILLLLCGCAKTTATENIANSAINTTTAIEKSLTADCATESIKTQIQAVKTQINAIVQTCETEKAEIRADKVKWQTAFWALLVVVSVFVMRKVLK